MWELVTRLLWLPFDIMQRISHRFLSLGRSVYGGLFGPGKPAIKPKPPSRPVSPRQSPVPTIPTTMSLPSTSSVVIDVESEVETSALDHVIATHQYNQSVLANDSVSPIMAPLLSPELSAKAISSLASNASASAGGSESAGSKRLRTKEKRSRKDRKQTSVSESGGGLDEAVVDRSRSSKKQRLSEDASKDSVGDSCQESHDDNNKPKRKKRRPKKKKKEKDQEDEAGEMEGFTRPNFFVAVQISSKDIHSKVAQVQRTFTEKTLSPPWHGLTSTEIFKDAMIPVEKLHFTLHVIHLKGEEDLNKAQSALEECWREVYQEFVDNPVELTIEGLGHFRNSVIYAQLRNEKEVSRLGRLSELIRKKFAEVNIHGDPRPFKPHMTIAKISRSNKLHKRKIRSFPPDIWEGCEESHFGTQRVNSIQLLYMAGEDKLTKYYRCFCQYSFLDPLSPLKIENVEKAMPIPSLKCNESEDSEKNTS